VALARVPFPLRSPDEVLEAVRAAVTPRTRLALLDHVTSPTGLVLPIERLVPELEGRGVACLVDGAHALGMLPLDLGRLGASYYTANAHKWLCAPKGAAILHVRADVQARVRPLAISHGAAAQRADRSRFLAEFDWVGTDDPSPYLVLPECIAFLEGLLPGGLAGLQARNRALVLAGRARLLETLGLAPPCPEEMLGALAAVPLPPSPAAASPGPLGLDGLQADLAARGFEVPVFLWPAPPARVIRISAQAYNAPEDYALLAAALAACLAAEAGGSR
jgi:isopenicillin-N epimerase